VLTVPVAPVRLNVDPDRLRQALDAMFREVSATADSVSVDCRTEKGSVAISIGSASGTFSSGAAKPVRGDDPAVGTRAQLARVLVAAPRRDALRRPRVRRPRPAAHRALSAVDKTKGRAFARPFDRSRCV